MIDIGQYHELRILRETSVGLFLGDESGEDVLLPNKYRPEKFEIGDLIEVFVYRDHEERKVATNLTPKIFLNDFALLQVTAVTEVGAFMDWGLEKELMVPFNEQRQKMEEGRWYLVYMTLDKKTDRLFASNKIEKFLQNDVLTVKEGDAVDLVIMQKTDLGFSAIIDNAHKGLIYENEIFRKINVGDKFPGFIKKIREGNKIDVSLHPIGYQNFNDPNCQLILQKLTENNGFLALTDQSSPEDIYTQFGISKKAYKKAIGALFKQRRISLEKTGIKLA
ncbi:MAG TPA: S1-like domain-containing RNA-binding protein [Cyclobacteriaceae bacterium]